MLVSRPVQVEIDRQKGGGNNRLSKRARSASSLFRYILLPENNYYEVRNAKPIVRLYLRQDIKPDESLSDRLMYSERDDQLVGITAQFSKDRPDSPVILLTHDTGPMASAKMVGVNFRTIPDEWLLAPETSETDKQINKLQAELTRLKQTAPNVEICFENQMTGESDFNLETVIYSALTEEQVSKLLERINSTIFPESNFNVQETDDNTLTGLNHFRSLPALFGKPTFTPATDEDIALYKDEQYPDWIRTCEKYLCVLHEHLNELTPFPEVTVWLSNTGTRPTEDTLVTLSANGKLLIIPSEENDEENKLNGPALPLPPEAPKGKWETINPLMQQLNHSAYRVTPFSDSDSLMSRLKNINNSLFSENVNPNLFYYQQRPERPVKSYSLTCKQWRHQNEEEPFSSTIFFERSPGKISGTLEAKVQATNMADPVTKRKPIYITVTEVSALEKAEQLVESLIQNSKANIKFQFRQRVN
nr:PIN domain-containing protein [Budvicia diplopodorum]